MKSHVLYAAGANPCSSSTAPTVPDTPCKKWEARAKANKAVALALKSEVGFGDNSIQLSSSGKKTLNKVANVLKKYPWMKIAVEAHSDAPAGSTCRRLTAGRAASTEKYLKSQGVSNPMAKPRVAAGSASASASGSSSHCKTGPDNDSCLVNNPGWGEYDCASKPGRKGVEKFCNSSEYADTMACCPKTCHICLKPKKSLKENNSGVLQRRESILWQPAADHAGCHVGLGFGYQRQYSRMCCQCPYRHRRQGCLAAHVEMCPHSFWPSR